MFTKTSVTYKITTPFGPEFAVVQGETTDETTAIEFARNLRAKGEKPAIIKTETVMTKSTVSF